MFINSQNQYCNTNKCNYLLESNYFSNFNFNQTKNLFSNIYPNKSSKIYNPKNKTITKPHSLNLPDQFNWTEKNKVTPVKNQGECGSCYAFSATGAIESAYAIKTNKLISLSEQQFIDCETTNKKCKGGIQPNLQRYAMNHSIESEDNYPQIEDTDHSTHNCSYDPDSHLGLVRISNYVEIDSHDEDEMLRVVGSVGPISCDMDALGDGAFYFYKSGVFSSDKCSRENTNHAVLITGQGATEDGLEQWIVKNSFGGEWGDSGQFKIERGVNMCAISTYCSQPVINHEEYAFLE